MPLMFPSWLPRLPLPRSLRWQFILALSVLVALVLAGSLTAVYALRMSVDSTRQLAEERLLHLQDAQDLVRYTLLIERDTNRMLATASLENMRSSYTGIIERLGMLDLVVERLVADNDDVAVLSLHQSGQLFRNTAHVVADLQESALQTEAGAVARRFPSLAKRTAQQETLRHFHDELQRQAAAMATAAQEVSAHITLDYREAVMQLADTSRKIQRWVLALLAGSLIMAWLVSRYFLGRHVLTRLQQVSHYLRRRDTGDVHPRVPVQGIDEIGEMARAVELFLEDRQQLAEAHKTLQTERVRQEELIKKLAESQSQLLQSDKMASVGLLAAGVAHDINNPVCFVNTNLATMRRYVNNLFKTLSAYEAGEGELKEDTRTALGSLKQELGFAFMRKDMENLLAESMDGLQRVMLIVQDLKGFSCMGKAEKQWANLEQGLDSTLNVAWSEIKYKAEVIKEYGGIPEIECIPSRLNQVFMNLLVNAAHAIEGHGKITIRTGQVGGTVWVEVEDTGTGIEPEHLSHIFTPFYTTKPVGKGTGLGLSLSYDIVQKHGGLIEVKSEVGVGSVFRVTLPIRAVSPST